MTDGRRRFHPHGTMMAVRLLLATEPDRWWTLDETVEALVFQSATPRRDSIVTAIHDLSRAPGYWHPERPNVVGVRRRGARGRDRLPSLYRHVAAGVPRPDLGFSLFASMAEAMASGLFPRDPVSTAGCG